MKNRLIGLLLALVFAPAFAAVAHSASIKDGTILYTSSYYLGDEPLMLGVDPYGYNYNAKMFSGSYFNAYSNRDNLPPYSGDDAAYLLDNPTAAAHGLWPYREVHLAMKWNDAWLSNKDQDNDGSLDRHFGLPSYIGSGAWITNHMSGSEVVDGKEVRWNYFVKIVAAPADATKVAGTWFDTSGNEIGPDIWGEFIVIQEVINDPAAGAHGLAFKSMTAPGFGKY